LGFPACLDCQFHFFGFSCRKVISATGFTVLGIVNKLLTVVINLVIWDNHATFIGTIGLLICMLGGILYQQSVSKPPPTASEPATNDDEEQLLELPSSELKAFGNEVVPAGPK